MVTTMVNIKINGLSLSVPEGTTILTAAESHGISIPHLCYLEKINEIGACRLCCVEVKGEEKLVPSCITKAAEGMEVVTNSQRVRSRARTNLQFLMSQHDGRCTQCVLSGNCRLQTLCNEMNISLDGFYEDIPKGRRTYWTFRRAGVHTGRRSFRCSGTRRAASSACGAFRPATRYRRFLYGI